MKKKKKKTQMQNPSDAELHKVRAEHKEKKISSSHELSDDEVKDVSLSKKLKLKKLKNRFRSMV